jgi:AraC family transcriptional activator FtrA
MMTHRFARDYLEGNAITQGTEAARLPLCENIMPNRDPLAFAPNRLVVALVYEGLCTFEFAATVEVFGLHRPEMGADWYSFAVASLEQGPFRANGGFRVVVEDGPNPLQRAGTIIIPGWRDIETPVPSAVCDMLRAAKARGVRIAAICSGVFPVAAAGLLDGRRATTHWRHRDVLRRRYPGIEVVADELYVDEGDVLTAAGGAAAIDLCLHLVQRDFGTRAANQVAQRLIAPLHREGRQSQFIERPMPARHEGTGISELLDMMRARIDERHTIASLAKASGMSVRTFLRKFKATTGMPPGEWLVAERLNRARELLESSNSDIENVAFLSGFGCSASLRHHFRKRVGVSPAVYRANFTRP